MNWGIVRLGMSCFNGAPEYSMVERRPEIVSAPSYTVRSAQKADGHRRNGS